MSSPATAPQIPARPSTTTCTPPLRIFHSPSNSPSHSPHSPTHSHTDPLAHRTVMRSYSRHSLAGMLRPSRAQLSGMKTGDPPGCCSSGGVRAAPRMRSLEVRHVPAGRRGVPAGADVQALEGPLYRVQRSSRYRPQLRFSYALELPHGTLARAHRLASARQHSSCARRVISVSPATACHLTITPHHPLPMGIRPQRAPENSIVRSA